MEKTCLLAMYGFFNTTRHTLGALIYDSEKLNSVQTVSDDYEACQITLEAIEKSD